MVSRIIFRLVIFTITTVAKKKEIFKLAAFKWHFGDELIEKLRNLLAAGERVTGFFLLQNETQTTRKLIRYSASVAASFIHSLLHFDFFEKYY